MKNEIYPQGRVVRITLQSITGFVFKDKCESKTLDRDQIESYLDEIRESVINTLEERELLEEEN